METTYRIDVDGAVAKVHGIAGKHRVHHHVPGKLLVLVREGRSENPGSRYSMLMSYYPAEFQVYRPAADVEGRWARVAEFPVRRS